MRACPAWQRGAQALQQCLTTQQQQVPIQPAACWGHTKRKQPSAFALHLSAAVQERAGAGMPSLAERGAGAAAVPSAPADPPLPGPPESRNPPPPGADVDLPPPPPMGQRETPHEREERMRRDEIRKDRCAAPHTSKQLMLACSEAVAQDSPATSHEPRAAHWCAERARQVPAVQRGTAASFVKASNTKT